MTITAIVAASVANTSFDSLPEATRAAAKRSILDTIGIMIPPGQIDETCKRLAARVVADSRGTGPSLLVGMGVKTLPVMAAFLNGCFAHALDYGDTVDSTGHHPSGQSLPAALAVAQARAISGKDFLTAIAVAQDIGTRLSTARGPSARADRIWFAPTLFGPFSATIAAGKVMGLSAEEFINSLGLALHRAHGQLGAVIAPESEIRALRYGLVAQDGVMCAFMAEQGMKAYHDGIKDLYTTYYGGDYDADALVAGLGEIFHGVDASIKPWPCCRASHGYVEAIRMMIEQYAISPEVIDVIFLDANAMTKSALGEPEGEKRRPRNGIQAKASLQFTAAVAVLKEPVISDFLDAALDAPSVLALADRVIVRQNDACGQILPVSVKIRLKDGRSFIQLCTDIVGTPTRPMSEARLLAKFRDCLSYRDRPMVAEDVNRLIDMIENIEKLTNLAELGALLP